MSKDVVLDTHILVDFLSQYFKYKIYIAGNFKNEGFINKQLSKKLNSIVDTYRNEETFNNGIVVTSIFSFVEIARQFSKISDQKFSIYQFKSFLENKPEWMDISALENNLFLNFFSVPKVVVVGDQITPIEWPDAVHCSTYLMRESAFFATEDKKIKAISGFNFI
jgi:hypothetical protein